MDSILLIVGIVAATSGGHASYWLTYHFGFLTFPPFGMHKKNKIDWMFSADDCNLFHNFPDGWSTKLGPMNESEKGGNWDDSWGLYTRTI